MHNLFASVMVSNNSFLPCCIVISIFTPYNTIHTSSYLLLFFNTIIIMLVYNNYHQQQLNLVENLPFSKQKNNSSNMSV